MMGYQESLTDPVCRPSFNFHISLIGNYGIHLNRSESSSVWPRGVVVRHAMKEPDHRDSVATVNDLLRLQYPWD